VVPLNIRIDEFAEPKTLDDLGRSFTEISHTIKEQDADIGLMFDTDAERVTLFDEGGRTMAGDTALALMAKVALKEYGGGKVVVPATSSQAVEMVCARYGCSVIRSKLGAYQLVKAVCEEAALFGGDERGGFILPNFQRNYDAIAAKVKLLEAMAREQQASSDMVREIPLFVKAEGMVNCPWRCKGEIMRALIDEARSSRIDTTEGLKVFHKDGWVAISPSSEEPVMSLYAEASSKESAEALISSYIAKIHALIPAPRS
jgi:mannose-1-phosphate guanylyltransferase/phosphomannomutase